MKRAVLKMSDCFLMDFLRVCKTNEKADFLLNVQNPLPADTRIVRCGHDSQGVLCLVVESEEFEDIMEGNRYPTLDPVLFKKIIRR